MKQALLTSLNRQDAKNAKFLFLKNRFLAALASWRLIAFVWIFR
jgi:hypothetical protein